MSRIRSILRGSIGLLRDGDQVRGGFGQRLRLAISRYCLQFGHDSCKLHNNAQFCQLQFTSDCCTTRTAVALQWSMPVRASCKLRTIATRQSVLNLVSRLACRRSAQPFVQYPSSLRNARTSLSTHPDRLFCCTRWNVFDTASCIESLAVAVVA